MARPLCCELRNEHGGSHFDFFFVNSTSNEELEVITAVVIKSYVFCDIVLCSPLKVKLRFEVTYNFHLRGRRIRQKRNYREA
jgi:hypothetical protein